MTGSRHTRRNSRSIKTLSSAPSRAATGFWPSGRPPSWESRAAAVSDYVKAVVRADLQEKGDEDVFRKIRKDFDDAGVSVSDAELRAKMGEFLAAAVTDIEATKKA